MEIAMEAVEWITAWRSLPPFLAVVAVLSALAGVVCGLIGARWGKAVRRPITACMFAWCVGIAVLGAYDVKTVLGLGYTGHCPSYTHIKTYLDPCRIEAWRRQRWFPSEKFPGSLGDPELGNEPLASWPLRLYGLPNTSEIWFMRLVALLTFSSLFLVAISRRGAALSQVMGGEGGLLISLVLF
jgi:hypothetical protein